MDNHQDLISRKAAIEETLQFCPEKTKPGSFDEYGATVLCGVIDVILKQLPAVDAVPMVHGRWKQTDAYPHWLYCLNCYKRIVPNVEWIEAYNIPTNYCPNCGAKMDGERRDDDAADTW